MFPSILQEPPDIPDVTVTPKVTPKEESAANKQVAHAHTVDTVDTHTSDHHDMHSAVSHFSAVRITDAMSAASVLSVDMSEPRLSEPWWDMSSRFLYVGLYLKWGFEMGALERT